MLDQFSATVQKIYAAAADASLWEEALRAIEDYTGSTGAVLNLVPTQPTAVPFVLAGSFSRADCTEYAQHYMWRCPRIAFGQSHPDIAIHFDRMILSESEMDRDATYEWYGKHGLRYYVAGWAGESGTHRAYMSLQRSRRQGHVEPEQVEQFALLLKHVAQACAFAVRLGTLEQQGHFNLSLLDRVPHAAFVLGRSGNVVLTNAKADRLLDRGDGLLVVAGELQCRLSSQQPMLNRLIAQALGSDPLQPRGGWVSIHRSSGLRPYAALLASLDSPDDPFSAFAPKLLVIVVDPDATGVPDQHALRELFGLTDAEARVATALSAGHSLESAAASLNVQIATARSQLKAVFTKLGVNRQQDLVRLLASLTPMQM